jgi:hypothetical protein
LDSTGRLYVNDFHRNVASYNLTPFPPVISTTFAAGPVVDTADPTGVAVRSVSDNLYVDDRTHISVYDSTGALVEQFGGGDLEDGYGIALLNGKTYVADAVTNTVKVFEPSVSTTNPVATISGPPGGFSSLVDSALAIDAVSGDVYVADRTGSRLTEHPETTIYVFSSTGVYKGHLKYNVIDGSPVGLAVDNSVGVNQGRVYVTSGNTTQASIYAYPPGAATFSSSLPASFNLGVTTSGAGSVSASALGIDCSGACEEQVRSGAEVSLVANPDPGSVFSGWSGDCSGADACTVTMGEAASISAEFEPAQGPEGEGPAGQGASPSSTGTRAKHRRHRKQAKRRHHHPHHRKSR